MNPQQKILFIDRDGTLIVEPPDHQIDTLEKFQLISGVIPHLLSLKTAGYRFVMVSNQDGLGSETYSMQDFQRIQDLLLHILASQGITFDDVLICPHQAAHHCECRKPKLGLVMNYLKDQRLNLADSYVIGDRETDLLFAENLGITGLRLGVAPYYTWEDIANSLVAKPRKSTVRRQTTETTIEVSVNLDEASQRDISTGLGFFDHMLDQLAKHGAFGLVLNVRGDLHIDEHHTVEDTALALGAAIHQALGDRRGITRYSFLLPMDEALATIALDLSGRPHCRFEGQLAREQVGQLPTELVPHFFASFAEALKATLHIRVEGENTHHQIEAIFKGVGRTLRVAKQKIETDVPSTKGML